MMRLSFSFSPKNGQFGSVGFSLLNVDYGELQGTMVWDNDQGFIDTEKFSPSALALVLDMEEHFLKTFPWVGI